MAVASKTHLPTMDLRKPFPPTLMADTITVGIPIGAIPRRTISIQPIVVERNCFVSSSPKSVSSGARLVKALLAKFDESTVGGVAAIVMYVTPNWDKQKICNERGCCATRGYLSGQFCGYIRGQRTLVVQTLRKWGRTEYGYEAYYRRPQA